MRNIIRLTNDFILRAGVHALPLTIDDLAEICTHLGYSLLPYQRAEEMLRKLEMTQCMELPACTICIGNSKVVLFDSALSTGTRIFAIAHEIGHIVLQHNYSGVVGFTNADSDQEREANTFAFQLIAPLCILRALDITDVGDIESRTLLDHDRAKKVHKALHHYREQPREDDMIKAYGISLPQKKFDFATLLVSLAIFLVAISIFFRVLPDPQPAVTATQDFFAQLRQEQTQQTDEVLAPISSTESTDAVTTETPEQSETVYITHSGQRYHKQNCYHIKNSTTITSIPLSEAIQEGYTACKSCYK